jgi:hypothetical protein
MGRLIAETAVSNRANRKLHRQINHWAHVNNLPKVRVGFDEFSDPTHARARAADADIVEAPAPDTKPDATGVLTMRLLAELELHQIADLPIDFETGPLASNLRSAAFWLKSEKSKGYADPPERGLNRGGGTGVWHPWVLERTWP